MQAEGSAPKMGRRPLPVALSGPLFASQVERHRDIWCRHYDDCLDQACKRAWKSWSCLGCPLKGQAQERPELRTGGDSILVEAAEVEGLVRGSEAPKARATMANIYPRLTTAPQAVTEIAGGIYTNRSVEGVLRRLRERGIAATRKISQSSGVGAGYGWVFTGRKICTKCERDEPAENYPRNAGALGGRGPECRPCTNERKRAEAKRARERGGA